MRVSEPQVSRRNRFTDNRLVCHQTKQTGPILVCMHTQARALRVFVYSRSCTEGWYFVVLRFSLPLPLSMLANSNSGSWHQQRRQLIIRSTRGDTKIELASKG